MPRADRHTATASVVLFAFLTACSSSSSGGTAATPPSVTTCPSPPKTGDPFPAGPASRVPHPAFAESPKKLPVRIVTGQDEVQFTTAMPLREAAAFVHTE